MQRQKKRVKTDKIMSADSWRLKTKMTDHFLKQKKAGDWPSGETQIIYQMTNSKCLREKTDGWAREKRQDSWTRERPSD